MHRTSSNKHKATSRVGTIFIQFWAPHGQTKITTVLKRTGTRLYLEWMSVSHAVYPLRGSVDFKACKIGQGYWYRPTNRALIKMGPTWVPNRPKMAPERWPHLPLIPQNTWSLSQKHPNPPYIGNWYAFYPEVKNSCAPWPGLQHEDVG